MKLVSKHINNHYTNTLWVQVVNTEYRFGDGEVYDKILNGTWVAVQEEQQERPWDEILV